MPQIIELVIPLFALIGLGRLAFQRAYIDGAGVAALTGFTYWVALPALLIGSVVNGRSDHIVFTAGIYIACCIIVFFLSIAIARIVFGYPIERAALFGLNATYGNIIFLGTPLVASVFGQEGVALILVIIALHSGVLLPLAAVMIEIGTRRQGGALVVCSRTARSLAQNPVIMSIVLAFLWKQTALPLPPGLHGLFALLAPAASPLALFCLGASLPLERLERSVVQEAALATFIKLLLLPLAVGWASWFCGLAGLPWRVALLTAAMPTGANAFLLARKATTFAAGSAMTVVLASVISILTICLLVQWLQGGAFT